VDLYLDADNPEMVPLLRREVVSYLRRHATPDSDLTEAELLVAEVVGNASRHTAGPAWVSLTWRQEHPTLTVYDLGPGFDTEDLRVPENPDPLSESGRGLFIIRHLAPRMQARARVAEGMVVSVELPVAKPAVATHDPPLHRSGVLPDLSEARQAGGFGKEAFLRALVVQLAQALEIQHGPDAADAAVAQVGMDVGGQMEQEFRAAEQVVGAMDPDHLGRCYVRLKHAIDGGFYVIEATPERIVLGNHRCPFGEVVQRAPSLCRMTSSVFGGIAARNSEENASVLLEERIAVGDPGCRVVVYLGPPPEAARPFAHVYAREET